MHGTLSLALIARLALGLLLISCGQVLESKNPTSEIISEDNSDDDMGDGSEDATDVDTESWLIPVNEVFGGGPGKDGIPAISNPKFKPDSTITFLSDDDLVIGVKFEGQLRTYAHLILDWHEIVNDNLGQRYFALTYCPLTGSAIAWDRNLGGEVTTFGVSGLLYNSNLIPYDRATGSNWSQMKLLCVQGENRGQVAGTFRIVETTWKTWREMYPGADVMTTDTGYSRSYGFYPYGSYRTSDYLLFPVSQDDSRLPKKERVIGLMVGDQAKVYRLGAFADSVNAINDVFQGETVVAAGSRTDNLMVIYHRQLPDGTVLTFTPLQGQLPVVMKDNEGTTWDIFGRAVSGPRSGAELTATRSYIAYWFAWATFFPSAQIYGE